MDESLHLLLISCDVVPRGRMAGLWVLKGGGKTRMGRVLQSWTGSAEPCGGRRLQQAPVDVVGGRDGRGRGEGSLSWWECAGCMLGCCLFLGVVSVCEVRGQTQASRSIAVGNSNV